MTTSFPTPAALYQNPIAHLSYITERESSKCEGSHFDRKQAGHLDSNGKVTKSSFSELRETIEETISAFANAQGGVIVVGVDNNGTISGIDHLDENQVNSISKFDRIKNHTSQTRIVKVTTLSGDTKSILIILVPEVRDLICETTKSKCWLRMGMQNIPLDDLRREQLKRDKKIVSYENASSVNYLDSASSANDLRNATEQGMMRRYAATYSLRKP